MGYTASYVMWRDVGLPDVYFRLGNSGAFHFLSFFNGFDDSHNFMLKAPSEFDGPEGFLVGTAIPVPPAVLLLAGPALLLAIRHRIQRPQAAH